MPRLPTSLILRAYREDTLLPSLLKGCRTLEQARNELRWLRESVFARYGFKSGTRGIQRGHGAGKWWQKLKQMCIRRGRGEPLQYILGDQPFGDLEILCEKGVLIPRVETELYTFHARDVILKGLKAGEFNAKSLRILDPCSGSGCISLLLHSLLAPHVEKLTMVGADVSPQAVKLSQKNKVHNLKRGLLTPRVEREVIFKQCDVLGSPEGDMPSLNDILQHKEITNTDISGCRTTWDVVISNPPYISPSNLVDGTTSRSVRKYEPIQALVPPIINHSVWGDLGLKSICHEDIFYPRLLSLAYELDVKLIVLECGDIAQARRVLNIARPIFRPARRDGIVSMYIYSGYDATKDCDDGARAVVVRRF